jgi:uncharacterized protein YecT (DUF1311 family)
LLDSSRERGQAALSYQILQEMAARRERREKGGPKALFTGRRPAEPRVISVDFSDPLERENDAALDDLPPLAAWRTPPSEPDPAATLRLETEPPAPRASRRGAKSPRPTADLGTGPEPPEPQDEPPPLTNWGPSSPEPDVASLQLETPTPSRPPRRSSWLAAGFAAGIAAGVAVGWWGAAVTRGTPPLRVASADPAAHTAAPPALKAARAAATPANAPVAPIAAEPEPIPEAPSDATVSSPPPESQETTSAFPAASDAARDTAATAPAPQPSASAPAPTEVVRITPAGPKGCAAKPTPADRTICEVPKLQRLQRDLQASYAKALAAHEDRDLLREHQLAWRDARNDVSDPDRLARLYEQRIQKLKAATAVARQQREAPH